MLCRDRCGYCTFAKPPARLDVAVPHRRRGARARDARAPRSAATRRCSRWARRPRSATRRPPSGSRDHGYASTVDYLVAVAQARARRDRPAPPRQRGRALARPSSTRLRAREPVAGDDDRDARRPPARTGRRRTTARPTRPRRAASRRSTPRAARGCRSPPASSSASARRAPSASTRSSRSPNAHLEHGHVQEVIVQNFLPKPGTAMHRAEPCPPDEFLWSIAAARLDPAAPTCTCRRRRT